MSFLDKLPKLPFGSPNKSNFEYYFGLNIEPDQVVGSVWGIEGEKMKIVNTAKAPYKSLDSSPDGTGEGITEAANFALDQALADFEPEPAKILFGVPDDWLLDEDLKPEYLKVLKHITRELDVVPMAYVSTTHAICHLLQKQQGVPVTAVLVNISDPLTVSVVKAGKILGSKSLKRSANLPEDIEKALISFTDIEVLPSKILIYGREDLNKYKQELLSFAWMAQLPFLHLPKIEELEADMAIKSVSFAGGSELNGNVTLISDSLSKADKPHTIAKSFDDPHENVSKERKELEDLGFVAGDIEERKKENVMIEDEDLSGGLGVDVYGDNFPTGREDHAITEHHAGSREGFKDKIISPLANFSFPLPSFGAGIFGSKTLILPVVIIVLLIGAFLFFQKATVEVFVDLKTLEKEATVTADPNVKQVDEANKVIPGSIVSTDISGSGKGTATGKKQVGDPAKGAVVLYNKTSSPKTFSSGTVLIGPGSMTFTLDSSVNVASQSAVEGGISFGKTTANVTAGTIGPDGNLAAGKELTIKGQDSGSFSAKVDTALSGGISKDVTVVTADDQKRLLAQVSSDLREKAKNEIQGKLTGDSKIISEGLVEKISKQSYSKSVGDQASEFSLNLSANYKGTAYSDADLKLIVSKLVEINVPEGYSLDLTKTETQADVSKVEKDGKLIFAAKFKAKLMPKIDHEKVKKDIAGKTPGEAASILKNIENVIGSNIVTKPSLPGPLQRLPFIAKNITLEVTAK